MSKIKHLVTEFFKSNNISVPPNRMGLFDKFLSDEQNQAALNTILENQEKLMNRWRIKEKISAILDKPVRILNATVGKPYETKFDFEKFEWKEISSFEFEGLDEAGLYYDEKTKQITGVPTKSGDLQFRFKFKVEGQKEDDAFSEKLIPFIINPDPKTLWKNIESDRNDPHWKEDNVTVFAPLGERHILASSKRGRSHANVGSFREDDFAFKNLDNGWSLVVVADGAGSAKISRRGSAIACNEIINFFCQPGSGEKLKEMDNLVQSKDADAQKKIERFVYNNLGKAVFTVHKQLEEFAKKEGVGLKDLSSTLIFALFKKYGAGYAILSFGVGDCPIAVLNKDVSEVTMMNWLDVGEYGGGTRFITMPEIFQSEKFSSRFGFKMVDDFSYLMMMSDGIYDPKFVVESALDDIKNWKKFLADLGGKNEDRVKVELQKHNNEIEEQFSRWMDFWSTGNHDDRTLAIVF